MITKIIERILELEANLEPPDLTCRIEPAKEWQIATVQNSLHIELPPPLIAMWMRAHSLRLFEDKQYGQWGLIITDPVNAVNITSSSISQSPLDYKQGDLVIGYFLGDSEKVVIRCKLGKPDFGAILIALPIYSRDNWYHLEMGLDTFLMKYIESNGDKFWETDAGDTNDN